ncbi:MAG: succinate dehydrogenase cytochrome b subunit [Bryobacteraceae bacterium]
MGSAVVESGQQRPVRIFQSPVSKKAVMAVTGLFLTSYVIVHMLGNLQFFMGREQINAYAEFLHSRPAFLWSARVVLLASVLLHIYTGWSLWLLKRKARPQRYIKESHVPAGYASRTMILTGPLIGLYVVYHVLHLTIGKAGLPFDRGDVYGNLLAGFSIPAVSAVYIAAMVALSFHLYHGIWSMFQSMGVSHPRYTPILKRVSAVLAVGVAAGFIAVPAAVLAGLVGQ